MVFLGDILAKPHSGGRLFVAVSVVVCCSVSMKAVSCSLCSSVLEKAPIHYTETEGHSCPSCHAASRQVCECIHQHTSTQTDALKMIQIQKQTNSVQTSAAQTQTDAPKMVQKQTQTEK